MGIMDITKPMFESFVYAVIEDLTRSIDSGVPTCEILDRVKDALYAGLKRMWEEED